MCALRRMPAGIDTVVEAREQGVSDVEELKKDRRHAGGRPAAGSPERIRMGQVIRQYRRKAHMEQQDVGKQLGCSGNAIGGWETGRNGPSLDVIPRLCEVLNIPIYELMGIPAPEPTLPERDARSLANLRALNDYNRQTADQLVLRLLAEQDQAEQRTLRQYHSRLPYVDQLCPAAGPGAPAPDYAEPETLYLRASRASESSDVIMKVNGNSMEPGYPDGCRVFVNTGEETPIGEVGVFIVDGEFFIKQRQADCLYSLNRSHADIRFHENMDIKHYGRVIGIVDEGDVLYGEELNRVRDAFAEGKA